MAEERCMNCGFRKGNHYYGSGAENDATICARLTSGGSNAVAPDSKGWSPIPEVWRSVLAKDLQPGMMTIGEVYKTSDGEEIQHWTSRKCYKVGVSGPSEGSVYDVGGARICPRTEDYSIAVLVVPGSVSANGSKVISDYPKTCQLCNCPAYLGLNEVEHDPGYKKAQGCRGFVVG